MLLWTLGAAARPMESGRAMSLQPRMGTNSMSRGFCAWLCNVGADSEIVYKCTDYYAPETEGAVLWDSCDIEWPCLVTRS